MADLFIVRRRFRFRRTTSGFDQEAALADSRIC